MERIDAGEFIQIQSGQVHAGQAKNESRIGVFGVVRDQQQLTGRPGGVRVVFVLIVIERPAGLVLEIDFVIAACWVLIIVDLLIYVRDVIRFLAVAAVLAAFDLHKRPALVAGRLFQFAARSVRLLSVRRPPVTVRPTELASELIIWCVQLIAGQRVSIIQRNRTLLFSRSGVLLVARRLPFPSIQISVDFQVKELRRQISVCAGRTLEQMKIIYWRTNCAILRSFWHVCKRKTRFNSSKFGHFLMVISSIRTVGIVVPTIHLSTNRFPRGFRNLPSTTSEYMQGSF